MDTDMTEEQKDMNVASMIDQLLTSKERALLDGVKESDLVYIARNAGGERDCGEVFKNQDDCIEMLRNTRPSILCYGSDTTYDCLVVDGSNWDNVEREVDDEYATKEEFYDELRGDQRDPAD